MGRSKKPTAADMKKIRLVKMIQEVTSSGSSKDTWNPAEISEGLKNINFIRRLVDTWNPAQLNEAIRRLGFKTIDTWNPAIIDEMKAALIRIFALHSVTGNPITLNLTGELPYLIKEASVTFVPKQSGTGDPSPKNIRPISGWDGLNLTRNGVNQWDEDWELGTYNITTGEKSSSASNIRSKNKIPVVPGENLYFVIPTGITMRYLLYYEDQSYSGLTGTKTNGGTLEIPSGIGYMTFHLSSGTTYNNDISINYPSTYHNYHTYTGETYPATFDSTIYGGSYDFVSGEGSANMDILDLGTLEYTKDTSLGVTVFRASISSRKVGYLTTNYKCSQYKTLTGSRADLVDNDNSICGWNTSGPSIAIRDSSKDELTAAEFQTAMDGVQLCYELATPTPIELTAQEVEPLPGINVFSTDADTLNIKYQIDLS